MKSDLTHIDLFSGIGGFALAARWAGLKTVQFVEIDKFCHKILNKNLPGVPIHDDIKTFHWGDKCEVTSNKMQIDEILNSLNKQSEQGELFESVNRAENQCQCPQVLPIEDGNSVHESADMNTKEEKTHLTQMVENGCLGKIIQTTKMVSQKNVVKSATTTEKPNDGDVEYSHEINISVKNADLIKGNCSTPITLKHGKNIQKKDSTSIMELPYASNATKNNTSEIFLLTGGVPCQPASCAGKRGGHNDDRWLWEETFRVIAEVRPKWVILENVGGILSLEQGVVFEYLLAGLESQGYETETLIIPACSLNAPHRRDRVWIVAHSRQQSTGGTGSGFDNGEQFSPKKGERTNQRNGFTNKNCDDTNTSNEGLQRLQNTGSDSLDRKESRHELPGRLPSWEEPWLEVASRFCQLDDGVSPRLDGRGVTRNKYRIQKLKALGNAIVPAVAFEIMKAILKTEEEK